MINVHYICCMMQYGTSHAFSCLEQTFFPSLHIWKTFLWNLNDFTNKTQVVHFYLSLRSFHRTNNWPLHFSLVCDLNFVWCHDPSFQYFQRFLYRMCRCIVDISHVRKISGDNLPSSRFFISFLHYVCTPMAGQSTSLIP